MKYSVQSMLFAVLVGVTVNAHALCINPDSSLDDASVPRESIVVDMLPACKDREEGATDTVKTKAWNYKQQEQAPVKQALKSKNGGKSALIDSDCRAANGKSFIGYIGAAELLPACAP